MGLKNLKEGITFDDVLLIPQYSSALPSEVQLKTKLTQQIELQIPLISSAMDTVTEHALAIAMARQGGMGVIHKNLSIEEQSKEVDQVKRYESGMISNPITLNKESILKDAMTIMTQYKISGLPVIESDGTLIGIITNRDLKYQTDIEGKVVDFMTKDNLITSHPNITLEEAKEVLLKNRIEKLPIIDEKNKLCGLITIKDIDNIEQFPNACKDNKGRLRVGAAIGVNIDTHERVEALIASDVDVLVIDSAHGHSQGVLDTIKEIKKRYTDINIIGGNIVTSSAAEALIDAGCNALKVGIGPGSICTTRIVTGVGVPQITAISDTYKVAKKYNIPIIADGGIRMSGDIVKALAAGANCVMIGGLLAGTDEAPGEEIIYNGRKFKTYEGMGSLAAMKRGSKDRYFQTSVDAKKLVPEGIEGKVPYKGKLEDIVYQLCGGIRSGMGYCGTKTIEELIVKGEFIKITFAGINESHTHDVSITKEAPNYSR